MPITSEQKADRTFLAVIVGSLLLCAALLPVARTVDDHHDRMRPMYDDLRLMEYLQYQSLVTDGRAVPVDLEDGASATIAGEEFTPADGVHVVVEEEADSYCAKVSNQYGDVSEWHCYDPARPPRDPDGPARDPAAG